MHFLYVFTFMIYHWKQQVLAILCITRHLGETVVKFNHILGDRQWSYRSLTTYHGSEDFEFFKLRQISNAQDLAEIIVSQRIIQQLTCNNNPNPKT